MSSLLTSIWKRSPNKLRQSEIWLDYICLISLFVAALLLFLVNLGSSPILDGDEAIVAQVAKEIYQHQTGLVGWLFPTWMNEPYLERPPLMHGLIAGLYAIAGVNELTTRLPGAFLGAISVVLLYKIGREIFVVRLPALFSALIYLTCLPVIRMGRLAMLDGSLLCFEILTILAILRSRRDLRWALVAGIGLGAIGFTNGLLGLQFMAIALFFLAWDTPRLLGSAYLWSGISLGIAPLVAWYTAQWYHYPELQNLGDLIPLIIKPISNAAPLLDLSSWKNYLLLIFLYFVPWSIVIIGGLKLARNNVHWGWGKLVIIWSGVYIGTVLLLVSQKSWYFLPLYPALALAGGAKLDQVYNLPSSSAYPRSWLISFSSMAIVTGFIGLYFAFTNFINFSLPLIFGSLTLTFGATSVFIAKRERQFIVLLFWGLYISCFFFVASANWVGDIRSLEPVKPIANLINNNVPHHEVVYTSWQEYPSSLNFYSDRSIVKEELAKLKQHWQEHSTAYLLLDRATFKKLNISHQAIVQSPIDKKDRLGNFHLILAIKTPAAKTSV